MIAVGVVLTLFLAVGAAVLWVSNAMDSVPGVEPRHRPWDCPTCRKRADYLGVKVEPAKLPSARVIRR